MMPARAFTVCVRSFSNAGHHGERVSPAARFIANNHRVNLSEVRGTGKAGMIVKGDVLAALQKVATPSPVINATPTPVAQPPAAKQGESTPVNPRYTDIPNSNMRKVIAKRLAESKSTVPHFYASVVCTLDSALGYRKKLQQELGVQVSVNDIVIKAAALALRDMPDLHLRFDPKTRSLQRGDHDHRVDISVAVATPTGLITPIVTGADKRGLVDISQTVKGLAERARKNQLKPEEYQGGSFSISNLGMFGVSTFSAVINPPQACILAVGSGLPRLVPDSNGGLKSTTEMSVQLSADRRVVSEASVSQFLQLFRTYVSNPSTLAL